ncbi:tetratricopeptide repeat protein [Thermodesulfobacteriota bacterium]
MDRSIYYTRHRQEKLLIVLLLILAVLVAYWRIADCDFVGYDDKPYVTENSLVQKGLTIKGLIWAFTTFHAANWHPLTWLSHMLDCQLYGLNPLGHHWTSLQLHLANTLLLFFILQQMTGALWRSAFVAALFAIHPLHVESVAWVAERKDVLSTFFGMLTIIAYHRYVKQKGLYNYLIILLLYSLGLMAKPMLVTLPFVLLLLDFWPLKRLQFVKRNSLQAEAVIRFDLKAFFNLIYEKIPLFLLVVFSCFITFWAQRSQGAMYSLTVIPLNIRIANSFVSYVKYILKAVWPTRLIVLYPHAGDAFPIWQSIGAVLLIAAISYAAIRALRQRPYIAVGLFWYLGTLVPVIGLIQVGEQAMADRYTYIPLIGLFIAVTWGFSGFLSKWRYRKNFLVVAVIAILLALTVRTFLQVGHWQNAATLFGNAVKVTPDNILAQNNLGAALYEDGRFDEAIVYFKKALSISPEYTKALSNLGAAYFKKGNYDKAVFYFEKVLKGRQKDANEHDKLGVVLFAQEKIDEAMAHFKQAIQVDPEYANAHNNLANVLFRLGKFEEAELHFLEAIKLDPVHAGAHYNFGNLLVRQRQFKKAMIHFTEAIKINPDDFRAYNQIGVILYRQGNLDDAGDYLRRALEIRPGDLNARRNLEILKQALRSQR